MIILFNAIIIWGLVFIETILGISKVLSTIYIYIGLVHDFASNSV